MDASEILLRVRHTLFISRAELARLAQLSPSTVGRIEKGTLDPTWGTLSRIFESTGIRIHGEGILPVGDGAAASAARITLDRALDQSGEDVQGLTVSGPAQTWLERWRRAGWITDPPTVLGLLAMIRVAVAVSDHAGRLRASLCIGAAQQWRELALRIAEAGFDYAISDLVAGHELPQASLHRQPMIYVSDPRAVAVLLREPESAPGRGVRLIATDGPEFEGAVDGFAVRFTSLGQALIDGVCGASDDTALAETSLRKLLMHCPIG